MLHLGIFQAGEHHKIVLWFNSVILFHCTWSVGRRTVRCESCSLSAFSFSSCWLQHTHTHTHKVTHLKFSKDSTPYFQRLISVFSISNKHRDQECMHTQWQPQIALITLFWEPSNWIASRYCREGEGETREQISFV